MVSMSKAMSAGQAGTYFSKDNYYIKDGVTELGKWGGNTTEALGLSGAVEQKNFIELLNGYAPNSLTNEQIKDLEKLNKTETALTTEAENLSKMEDGEEKTALKEALDTKIKSYNEIRADFHKDVKTDGLHSKIKSLKEEAKDKPELLKEIKALEKEMNGTLKSDFRVGDSVTPSDRENRGTIVGFEKDGRAKVSFVNPETKKEVTKSFALSALDNNTPREKGETNSLGGKDGQLVRDGQNEFGIAMHRAGFDITFSASKSISTMALVAGDERLIDVHNQAMQTAMNYLEKEFAQTRTYDDEGNRQRTNTESLAYAQFTHYTSRATEKDATPDPQLHTHNFIMNATKAGENFMSLEPQQLFAAQKLADQIYQNEIARGAKDLGYGIEWNKHDSNYAAEIKGVDKELLDVLSSRTAQIDAIIAKEEKAMGREMTKEEKNNVTLSSRATKEAQDVAKIKDGWDNTLKNNGHAVESLIEKTKGHDSDKTIAVGTEQAVKMAVENLHSQKAVFSEHEILFEALKAAQGTASAREIQLAVQKNAKEMLVNDTDTFKVGVDHKNNTATLYSSKMVLKAEANIEKAVAAGKNKGSIMSKEDFDKQFEKIEEKKIAQAETEGKDYHSLTQGQKSALKHIATSKDQFIGIQGDAGSGKTTALERMKHITQALKETMGDDVQLIGLAPTNIAAGNIQKDSGIESRTIDSFINRPDDEEEGKQQVYLVDESSMLDTIKMSKLVEIAESKGAKVVLIGDTKQLKPVGAGAMFDRLQKTGQMEFAQVTEVLRQKDGTVAKEVVSAFKNIETLGKGLDKLQETGNLIEAKNGDMSPIREQFAKNAAKDYAEHGMNSTIALVSTNADRHEFNKIIRDDLIEKGAVAKEGKQITTLQEKRLNKTDTKFSGNYKVGEVLVVNKALNDIKTGSRAEISEINRADNTIKVSYKSKAGADRAKWLDAGKLDVFTAYEKAEKEFAVGDKVAFEKRDLTTNSQNGETGIIKAINPESGIWTVEKSGINTEIDPQKYPYIAHAYAMTVHKSQGQSIDRVHVFADSSKGGLSTNAGYVQMSRAKEELTVYTDGRENLEKAYKTEQLAENAGDRIDTAQFADQKDLAEKAEKMDFENPNGIPAPASDKNSKVGKQERADAKDNKLSYKAKQEMKAIDERIKEMRVQKDFYSQSAKEHWKNGEKSISNFNRKNQLSTAAQHSAETKDLAIGIRFQQLTKTEAKLLATGEVDLKSTADFMNKKGFDSPEQKKAFEASQGREREYLNKLVKDGLVIKDENNSDRFELATTKEKFQDYRESLEAKGNKYSIAETKHDSAVNDQLFEQAKGMLDGALIAGGTWNPKAGKQKLQEAGLLTKENSFLFDRIQARADRLTQEGLLTKRNGEYKAINTANLKYYVGSADDKNNAFRGEKESSQKWKEAKKFNEATAWIPGIKRIDKAIMKGTEINARTIKNDIVGAVKYTKYAMGADDGLSGAVAVTVGLAVGITKTVTRATAGALYRVGKIATKVAKGAAGDFKGAMKEMAHDELERYEKNHKPKIDKSTGMKKDPTIPEKGDNFYEILHSVAFGKKDKEPTTASDAMKSRETENQSEKTAKAFGLSKEDLEKEHKSVKDRVDEDKNDKSDAKDSKDEKSMEKEEKSNEKEREREDEK